MPTSRAYQRAELFALPATELVTRPASPIVLRGLVGRDLRGVRREAEARDRTSASGSSQMNSR